jgi:hypothetical protein
MYAKPPLSGGSITSRGLKAVEALMIIDRVEPSNPQRESTSMVRCALKGDWSSNTLNSSSAVRLELDDIKVVWMGSLVRERRTTTWDGSHKEYMSDLEPVVPIFVASMARVFPIVE